MKREEKNLSAKRRLYEARAQGAERFYEWNEPEDLRDRYNDVDVSGVTENIPLIVFEGDKKYLAAYHYEAEGRIDSKAEEIFQLTTFRFFYFGLYEFPKDGVITDSWNKNSAKVASIIDGYKGDIDRLDRITVTDGTPVVEALKAQAVKGAEKNYLSGYGDEWIYGWSDYEDADEAPDNEVGLSIFLNYEGELNGEPGKNIEESARKGENKMKKSSKRRIEEARAQGAKRFYEWDATRDRAWLRAHDKYLDRLAGDLNKPYDDSLEDKYDKVWVHGHTENVPLVVFEGDKKYLASYEYEVTGKIDANAEEVFQPTDMLEFLSFDLYDFPKAGAIPADWNEKNDVIVASISDDKERLAGITVADGTPVVKALEDQMIRGVEKEYFDGDVEEYYSDDYDPDYDDIELEVDLVYKGELNKRPSRDMNESVKKLRDRIKESSKRRRMKEDLEWSTIYTYEVENDDPLKVRSGDGAEYECNFGLECTADYDCDTYGVTGELRDYRISGISFEDAKDMSSYMDFSEEEIKKPHVQSILKGFVVIDADGEMPLLQYIDKFAEESVEDFAEEAEENLDYDDYYDPSDDYDPPRD